MKRFAFLSAFALGSLTAMYAQTPATQTPSPAQTGQAHIATPSPKPGESTTDKRNDDANRKKKKTNPPENPGVKAPITNPANGPVGTPTNPTPTSSR
jgi:hypothetical protein